MNDPIKHVILLKLENHSFDQMLGCFNSIYPTLEGVSERNFNFDSKSKEFFQKPMDYVQMEIDPNHEHENVVEQLSNGNSGFVKNLEKVKGCKDLQKQKIMAYYPKGSLPALHTLAENFTICDHWFSSVPGPTWPNRFFALTGTTKGFLKMPVGMKDLDMLINQDQTTIFDRLNEKNISWKVFYYDMPCSLILWNQRKAENVKNYSLIENLFDLIENGKEKDFPEFTFIEPKYFGTDQNDDHPPHNVMKAQKLIADVYSALVSNEELFMSSLLIVVYDEHGGFYDHVVPPPAIPPDENVEQYTFNQYGVRVPALLVSPYAKKDFTNVLFDHTSILKYLSDKWNLGPLGNRVASATSIGTVLLDKPRSYSEMPGFIRIPFSKLVAPEPELEERAENGHQEALELLWKSMESGTLAVTVESLKEFSPTWKSNLKILLNWKYWLGVLLTGFGRYLEARAKGDVLAANSRKISPAQLMTLATKNNDSSKRT